MVAYLQPRYHPQKSHQLTLLQCAGLYFVLTKLLWMDNYTLDNLYPPMDGNMGPKGSQTGGYRDSQAGGYGGGGYGGSHNIGFGPSQGMTYQPTMPPQHAYQDQGRTIVIDRSMQMGILPTNASFSKVSTKIACPNCHTPAMTRIKPKCGFGTILWSIILPPFSLICCCMPNCKDKYHFCSNCGAQVGIYKICR